MVYRAMQSFWLHLSVILLEPTRGPRAFEKTTDPRDLLFGRMFVWHRTVLASIIRL
jgi:hypothetical protein